MSRKNRTPEENARRAKIRELLQSSNIGSMDDAFSLLLEPLDQSVPFDLDRFLLLHRLIDNPKSITNIIEQIKSLYNDTPCHDRKQHITLVLAFLSCFASLLQKNHQYHVQLYYDPSEIKHYSDEALKKCFAALTEALTNLFNSATQYPYPIRKAITFIEQNYNSDINVKDVADQVELNPSYFGTLFKQYVGVSPISYIISVRMNHAKKLLK